MNRCSWRWAVIVWLACAPAWAQDNAEQVVSATVLKSPQNKENPIFAEIGDVLVVEQRKSESLLVLTPLGRRGWVRNEDVVPLKDAAPVFNKLIADDPKDPWRYYSRALAYNAQGEKEKELADLTRAIDLKIDGATAWINRGAAYSTSGEYDKAIADYDEAIRRGYTGPSV
ncbi:MAG: tetratricopeptide repeat protein, partial [Planctomycetales bacterium]|nr:tetratricopeptide repeat protein [Planctomycetales bacterium]